MSATQQPSEYKEVYFDKYCDTCVHKDEEPLEDTPCDKCLTNTVNLYSHKPTEYEEKIELIRKQREELGRIKDKT